MVIVLPNFLVGFGSKRGIGDWWKKLRDGIFSKPDQCLQIQDPIQMMLDRLQVSSQQDDPELLYFLRRLPAATSSEPDAAAKFLRSSLGAYRARQAKAEAVLESKIQAALAKRTAAVTAPDGASWQMDLASRTGVAPDVILQLDADLRVLALRPPNDTEGWLRWFREWLAQCQTRGQALFRHRIELNSTNSRQLDLFGNRLFEATRAWMSGESLQSLSIRLGAKPDKLGKCSTTRKFVLRSIPEIAYATGLAAQVYREQIDQGLLVDRMPLALATVSMCVRTGQSNPESQTRWRRKR